MRSDIHFSTGDNEHYTPKDFLDKVRLFYGGAIDLDPCSNSKENPHTEALNNYTIEDDGLTKDWFGRVFVNPPYSRGNLKFFVQKAIQQYDTFSDIEILLLVPYRTDTKWYHSLRGYMRCYIKGRLKFVNSKNKGNPAPFPSAIFYLGNREEQFRQIFGEIGEILK